MGAIFRLLTPISRPSSRSSAIDPDAATTPSGRKALASRLLKNSPNTTLISSPPAILHCSNCCGTTRNCLHTNSSTIGAVINLSSPKA